MIGFLRRRARARGPLGGSREWTIVWAVLVGVRVLRRLTRPKPEIVFRGEVRAGESLLISGDDLAHRVAGSG